MKTRIFVPILLLLGFCRPSFCYIDGTPVPKGDIQVALAKAVENALADRITMDGHDAAGIGRRVAEALPYLHRYIKSDNSTITRFIVEVLRYSYDNRALRLLEEIVMRADQDRAEEAAEVIFQNFPKAKIDLRLKQRLMRLSQNTNGVEILPLLAYLPDPVVKRHLAELSRTSDRKIRVGDLRPPQRADVDFIVAALLFDTGDKSYRQKLISGLSNTGNAMFLLYMVKWIQKKETLNLALSLLQKDTLITKIYISGEETSFSQILVSDVAYGAFKHFLGEDKFYDPWNYRDVNSSRKVELAKRVRTKLLTSVSK